MNSGKVDLIGNNLTVDVSTGNSYTGSGFGQKVNNNIWMLYAGNVDQSNPSGNEVNGADRILWQVSNGLFDIYDRTDFNLDRDINGVDKLIWNQNNGISSGVPK